MTSVRVKYFQIFTDRHGRQRCYHRPTGMPVDLQKHPLGSPEFFAECSRISSIGASLAPRPGTLALLIKEYRESLAFKALADLTKRDYEKVFDYLKPIGDTPVSTFDRALIVRIRDKAHTMRKRRFANYLRAVFSLLFSWGMERGYVDGNPAKGIKNIARPKNAPRANRPWTDQERFVVLKEAPQHLRVPIALCMYIALREGDALAITKTAYSGGRIEARTSKTGQRMQWPVPSELRKVLENAPKHDAVTIAANSYGMPWTISGFRASWRTLRVRLERAGKIGKGLTIHGLRHSMATRLREEGFDPRTIADALAQKTEGMAQMYSRDADLSEKMTGVVRSLNRSESAKLRNFVKPSGKIVKPANSVN